MNPRLPDAWRSIRHRSAPCAVVAAVLVAGCGATGGTAAGERPNRKPSPSVSAGRPTTPAAPTTTTGIPTTAPITAPPVTTTTQPSPPDIHSLDLRSGTYRVPCPIGGAETEVRPSQATSPTPDGNAVVAGFTPIFGDLTGDGRDDAVIEVDCTAEGGNGVVSSVVLVVSERNGLRQLGAPVDGAGPVLVGRTVAVQRPEYSGDDPTCCPSSLRYVPLSYQVDHLAEGASGPAAPLGGQATTTGLGELQVGRTYGELAAAGGRPVAVSGAPDANADCASVSVEGGPEGIFGLGDQERLRSLEFDDPAIRTRSGLGIGSTEQQVLDAFPGQVERTPHTYIEGGSYLLYTPTGSTDHVVVFDTDGAVVTHFRVGELSWAAAIEGCA